MYKYQKNVFGLLYFLPYTLQKWVPQLVLSSYSLRSVVKAWGNNDN